MTCSGVTILAAANLWVGSTMILVEIFLVNNTRFTCFFKMNHLHSTDFNGVSQNCFKSFQDKNSNKTFKFIPFFSYTRLVPGSEAIIEIIGRNRKVKIGSQLDICR